MNKEFNNLLWTSAVMEVGMGGETKRAFLKLYVNAYLMQKFDVNKIFNCLTDFNEM